VPAHINTWQQETHLSFVPQACSKLYAPNTKRTRVHWSLYQEVPYFNVLVLEVTSHSNANQQVFQLGPIGPQLVIFYLIRSKSMVFSIVTTSDKAFKCKKT